MVFVYQLKQEQLPEGMMQKIPEGMKRHLENLIRDQMIAKSLGDTIILMYKNDVGVKKNETLMQYANRYLDNLEDIITKKSGFADPGMKEAVLQAIENAVKPKPIWTLPEGWERIFPVYKVGKSPGFLEPSP